MLDVTDIRRFAAAAEPLAFGARPHLGALDHAVGDARVVLLGEQSHGDGLAIAAKAQVVEHLHRNLGFDVLAFEADFYALESAWRGTRTGTDVTALARHVYGFWREGPHVAPLWDLVHGRLSSERPLIVTGVDPRHSGAYPKADLALELEAHLAGRGVPTGPDWQRFRALLVELLEKEYEQRVDARDRRHFMEALARLREELTGADEASAFWRQELRNLAWTARNAWGGGGRDEGMGRNLAWLANERYPDKKIVVWAHNYHVVRSAAALDGNHPPYAREREQHPDTPLGQVAARELGTGVRSIALIAGQGWYAPNAWSGDHITRSTLSPPPPRSLEAELLALGLAHGYLDLKRAPEAFSMSGIEHDTFITAPWRHIFDGVIYLRDMTGLQRD